MTLDELKIYQNETRSKTSKTDYIHLIIGCILLVIGFTVGIISKYYNYL